MSKETVYYCGQATLHFGVRCRDVAALCSFENMGNDSDNVTHAVLKFYHEFKKQNCYIKIQDIKVTKLTKEQYDYIVENDKK